MAFSVLVLAGSAVDDFHAELSRVYARGFLEACGDNPAYECQIAFLGPGGSWCFPDSIDASSVAQAPTLTVGEAIERIEAVDLVVPEMFCLPGMTTYRALLDLLEVPYLGNRPDVMAMTADKSLARAIVSAAGVAVPAGEVVRAGERSRMSVPVVVKPVDADNSMGVTLVREAHQLEAAVHEALAYSEAALVESYIELGREVRCGILVRDGQLVCLPLEEYAVSSIRGRADKLDHTDDGDLYLVAKDSMRSWIVDVEDPITAAVWESARLCHVALGCRHYSLFDFRIDPSGAVWFLEASLYCSYSPSSVVAVMAAAAGIDIGDLFAMGVHELQKEVDHR